MSLSGQRVGLFGGSFNPFHLGHLYSIEEVIDRLKLDRLAVVPSYQNPLKEPVQGPTSEQRYKMVQLGLSDARDSVFVDDQEIKRQGLSYTVETILNYREQGVAAENLFFIMGMDTFSTFDEWKDSEKILKECNLAIISRPGYSFPKQLQELPSIVQQQTAEFSPSFIQLKSGTSVEFLKLKDYDISSSHIRHSYRTGKSVERYLPLAVEKYIKENSIYSPATDRLGDTTEFAQTCARFLDQKKAFHIKAFDLAGLGSASEMTLICSGTNTRQTVALAESLISYVKETFGVSPYGVEGLQEGRWVLVDYGSLIVHIFYDFVRQQYPLEELWREGQRLQLSL